MYCLNYFSFSRTIFTLITYRSAFPTRFPQNLRSIFHFSELAKFPHTISLTSVRHCPLRGEEGRVANADPDQQQSGWKNKQTGSRSVYTGLKQTLVSESWGHQKNTHTHTYNTQKVTTARAYLFFYAGVSGEDALLTLFQR